MTAFDKICKLAGQAVCEYKMLAPNDSVMLGISGGKDSLLLALYLKYLQKRAPFDFKFTAVTFNPMFPQFDVKATENFCKKEHIEHIVINFNMIDFLKEKDAESRPCVLCSRMRRGMIYAEARKRGIAKIALAHHLDDTVCSFLISMIRGGGLTSMGPNVLSEKGDLRVIRPFIFVEESLLIEAVEELGLKPSGKCMYYDRLEADGDRAFAKSVLKLLSEKIPDVRKNILHSLRDVRPEWLLDKKYLNLD